MSSFTLLLAYEQLSGLPTVKLAPKKVTHPSTQPCLVLLKTEFSYWNAMLLLKLNYLNSVKFESHLPIYQFFHNLGVNPCNLLILLTMFTRIFAVMLKLLDEL